MLCLMISKGGFEDFIVEDPMNHGNAAMRSSNLFSWAGGLIIVVGTV